MQHPSWDDACTIHWLKNIARPYSAADASPSLSVPRWQWDCRNAVPSPLSGPLWLIVCSIRSWSDRRADMVWVLHFSSFLLNHKKGRKTVCGLQMIPLLCTPSRIYRALLRRKGTVWYQDCIPNKTIHTYVPETLLLRAPRSHRFVQKPMSQAMSCIKFPWL